MTTNKQIPKTKIEFIKVTKRYGSLVANNHISFSVKENEVHALLGENGAGKSTLMSILFGIIKPSSGQIKVDGNISRILNARAATKLGIAMLPQHFNLVGNATVWQNIVLGYERTRMFIKRDVLKERIKKIQAKYKIKLDLNAKVYTLSVSDKQKVELLKILWNDASILIFDEPTSILTPNQVESFLEMIKTLQKEGKTILLITHKLLEIKAVAQRCSILRKGKYIKTVDVKTASSDELAEAMVGEKINVGFKKIKKVKFSEKDKKPIMIAKGVNLQKTGFQKGLKNVSFKTYPGEVLGVAAIEGNGESELFKIIAGLIKPTSGSIKISDIEITKLTIKRRYRYVSKRKIWQSPKNKPETKTLRLLSHIPEDRHAEGLILDFNVSKNIVLQDIDDYAKYSVINKAKINKVAGELVSKYDIRGVDKYPNNTKAKALSGGNQQKIILAREIERKSDVLIAFNPTRGLDVKAIFNVYGQILKYRNEGGSVVLYSSELDEIMDISDRIIVLYKGRIVKEIKPGELSKTKIGLLMAQGDKHE